MKIEHWESMVLWSPKQIIALFYVPNCQSNLIELGIWVIRGSAPPCPRPRPQAFEQVNVTKQLVSSLRLSFYLSLIQKSKLHYSSGTQIIINRFHLTNLRGVEVRELELVRGKLEARRTVIDICYYDVNHSS